VFTRIARRFAPLAAFVVLSGLAGMAEAAPRCDNLAKLHRSMFEPISPATVATAREYLDAKGEPDLGDADVVIRFFAPPGFGGDISTRTTLRRVRGTWFFVREDQSRILRRPPPPPMDVVEPVWDMRGDRAEINRLEGRLEPDLAAVLEAALSDPCLLREPDLGPAVLQLGNGRMEPCFDGAPYFLQIETAQGVRTIVHICQTRWVAGSIMRVPQVAKGVPGEVIRSTEYIDKSGRKVTDASLIANAPIRLRLSGDYAGRAMTIMIDGRRLYDSAADPPPASTGWLLYPPINPPPGSMVVTLQGCDPPAALEVPDADSVIAIQQCQVRVIRDALR